MKKEKIGEAKTITLQHYHKKLRHNQDSHWSPEDGSEFLLKIGKAEEP